MIHIKRAYDPPSDADGERILVDRLWPRGVSKERLNLARWEKELAPSTELRKAFCHDLDKWQEFTHRYRSELKDHGEAMAELVRASKKGTVTLIFAAKDETHNEAVVLKEVLEELGG